MKRNNIKSRITVVEIIITIIILLIILRIPFSILYGKQIDEQLRNILGIWYYVIHVLVICYLMFKSWKYLKRNRIRIRKSIIVFALTGLLLAALLTIFYIMII